MAIVSRRSLATPRLGLDTRTPHPRLVHGARIAALVATGVFLLFAAVLADTLIAGAVRRGEVGCDQSLYVRIAERWLTMGQAYWPAQLSGTYSVGGDVNLYPPVALYFFVPFAYLPNILWWAIPLAVIGATWIAYRPAWWSWPIFALILCLVPTQTAVINGNSDMWFVAFVCLATFVAPGAVLLIVKPTVAPVALFWASDRRWWIAAVALVVLSLPFWHLWVDYITAMRYIDDQNVFYSVNGLAALLAPALMCIARTRRRDARVRLTAQASALVPES